MKPKSNPTIQSQTTTTVESKLTPASNKLFLLTLHCQLIAIHILSQTTLAASHAFSPPDTPTNEASLAPTLQQLAPSYSSSNSKSKGVNNQHHHHHYHTKRIARSLFGGGELEPEFSEPIGNVTIPVGRDAQLACKISNLGEHRPAWLRVEDKGILTIANNVITRNYRVGLINDDANTSFTLVIKNVQPSDRGTYMCQINSKPRRFAVGFLDVLTPPAFVDSQPFSSSRSSTSPSPSSLSLSLSSATTPSTSATPTPTSGGDAPATNNAGQAASGESASSITVVEGENATLSCRATGHPTPTISWRRQDNEPLQLANGNQLAKFEGPALQLNSLSRVSTGAYLCIASNGVQPAASKRIFLNVQFSPVLRLAQSELSVQLGQDAQLGCFVDANPVAVFGWQRIAASPVSSAASSSRGAALSAAHDDEDSRELVNSDKHEIVIKEPRGGDLRQSVQLTLTIRKVSRHDLGLYRCFARNSLGVQSNTAALLEHTSLLGAMFGGGGAASQESAATEATQFSPGISRSRQQQPAAAGDKQRAHTRSWNQRPASNHHADSHQQPQLRQPPEPATAAAAPTVAPFGLAVAAVVVAAASLSHQLVLFP